jgi:hypothetical protein
LSRKLFGRNGNSSNRHLVLFRDPAEDVVLQEALLLLLEDPAVVLLLFSRAVLDLQQLIPTRAKQARNQGDQGPVLKIWRIKRRFCAKYGLFMQEMFITLVLKKIANFFAENNCQNRQK